jgi:hypothetical protein
MMERGTKYSQNSSLGPSAINPKSKWPSFSKWERIAFSRLNFKQRFRSQVNLAH